MSKTRYSSDWKQIATAVKDASNWRCSRCNRLCLRPSEKPLELSKSNVGFITFKYTITTSTHLITEKKTWAVFAVAVTFTITDLDEAIFHLGNCHCFNQMMHEYIAI